MIKQFFDSLWQRGKLATAAFFRRKDPVEYFIAMVLVSLGVFLLRSLIAGPEAFLDIFHLKTTDLFMDFFASLRDASLGKGAYTERHVMYPPMANLLLWLAARLFPRGFLSESLYPRPLSAVELRSLWGKYPSVPVAALVLLLFLIYFLARTVRREPLSPKKQDLLSFAVIFSFPLLFLYERGNLVLLCAVFMLIFAQNYNSENKVARELGLVALAFAASIKLYPALLGAALLSDRRYKEAGRCIAYGVALLILPSFFFGGPVSILWSMLEATSFSGAQAFPFMDLIGQWGFSPALGRGLMLGFYIFCFAFFALSAFLPRKRFLTWTFAAGLCMILPSVFSAYNWVLFLPALFAFFRDEKLEGINWAYFFLITLPFCFYLPKLWQDDTIIVILAALLILCAAETVIGAVKFFRQKKKAPEGA